MDTTRTTSLRKSRIDRSHLRRPESLARCRIVLGAVILLLILGGRDSYAQGVGMSESSITPDPFAILELRSTSRGFLLPRLATGSIGTPSFGMLIYNGTTTGNFLSFYNGAWLTLAPLASPTFTGTVTLPTPFTLGATSVTSTGTQLNYLNAATGTTGTTSTNLVFSTSPTLTSPTLAAGTATAASMNFTSGTNLTTAAAGAVEYDGKVFYNTAVASTRQVTTTQQFISNTSDFTMTFNAAGQSVFATGNDEINVAASTSYFFEGYYSITGMGATTRTTATLFAGTASFTSIAYYAMIQTGAANALATVQSTKNCVTATGNVLNATVATAAAVITVKGIMRINAGGTIIPQVDFSANPTGTILGMTNSWFRIWPIGTNTVAAVGNVQ